MAERFFLRVAAIVLMGCISVAARAAVHFVPVNGVTSITPSAGTVTNGLQAALVDDAGLAVPGQSVEAQGCGTFLHSPQTPVMVSDANGVVTLPSWEAPTGTGTCSLALNAFASGATFSFAVQIVGPVAVGLNFVATPPSEVAWGSTVTGIAVKVVDAAGNGVPGQVLLPSFAFGSLAGLDYAHLYVYTDASGVATLPAWTIPSENTTNTGGRNDVYLFGGLSAPLVSIFFYAHGVAPPPPPPTVVTTASGVSPQGGTINLSISSAVAGCTLGFQQFLNPAVTEFTMPLPREVSYPHGMIDFRTDNCGPGQSVTFNVDFPQDLPPTAQWWKWGPTPDNTTPHWYAIPATVNGKRISFSITDGGIGDDDLMMNGSISDLGMLAIPGGLMQDLWWSGPGENGWGMSIVQHRDVLFANMFVYDASGAPTWYVMPSGSWNSSHDTYTGNLYLPKGSPFFAYDGTRFDIGASVGTATIRFIDTNNASLDYTINGVAGHKNITRVLFGPQSPPLDKPLGDLWWAGGAQNGWGLAVLQQSSTLFALWFTYDADGKATWFVMPGGSWVMKDDYQGLIFKAVGPPWLGVTYDASRHHLTSVGTFRFRVNGDGAIFDYTADGKSGSINLSRIPF